MFLRLFLQCHLLQTRHKGGCRAKINDFKHNNLCLLAISSQPSRFRLLGRFSHTWYGSLVWGKYEMTKQKRYHWFQQWWRWGPLTMDQLSPLHLTIQHGFVNHPNVQKKPKRHIDQADLQVGFSTLDFWIFLTWFRDVYVISQWRDNDYQLTAHATLVKVSRDLCNLHTWIKVVVTWD